MRASRWLAATAAGLIAGSLVPGLTPGAAAVGVVTVTDAPDDGAQLLVESSDAGVKQPVPFVPTPELELVEASVAFDGKQFTLTWKVAAPPSATASGAMGSMYALEYNYGGGEFTILGARGVHEGDTVLIQGVDPDTGQGFYTHCSTCKLKFDDEAKTVVLTAGSGPVSAGMREIVPTSKPFKAGNPFTDLRWTTRRYYGAVSDNGVFGGYDSFASDEALTDEQLIL